MNNCKLIDLIARTATRADLVDLLRQHDAEIVRLKKREDVLVSAMSEISATNEGKSTQPIHSIVSGCIVELAAIDSENLD